MPEFKHIIVVSDGIRGHYHQSLGIAEWLGRLSSAKVEPYINVPKFSGLEKIMKIKISARKLPSHDANYAKKWLASVGIIARGFSPDTLFISAGSSAAPFCLALAKATGNKSAVVMTPSVLGTAPFDFAIIPKHDKYDPYDKSVITTLGAPNHIYEPNLKKIAEKFFEGKDFTGRKVIAVLIGGSDSNYKPSAEWAEEVLAPLKNIENAALLITTSRRTESALEEAVIRIFSGCPSLEYMLILSRNPQVNALTALLGAATHVIATEDSVSMVSEAVTAGFRVGLMRVPRVTNFAKKFLGLGPARFDEMFTSMMIDDLVEDLGDEPDFLRFTMPPEQRHGQDFNEAKRAAEWILNKE